MGKKRSTSKNGAQLPAGIIQSSWKGIDYVRSKPEKIANPRTPGQENQRKKMPLSLDFLRANILMVRSGFRFYKAKRSAFNAALSYMLEHGFKGSGENLEIDYSKVLLSRGELQKPEDARYSVVGNEVVVTWNPAVGEENCKASDRAMVSIFNAETNEAVVLLRGIRRADGLNGQRIELPESFGQEGLKIYLAFNAADDRLVSDSVLCEEFPGGVNS